MMPTIPADAMARLKDAAPGMQGLKAAQARVYSMVKHTIMVGQFAVDLQTQSMAQINSTATTRAAANLVFVWGG
jgi:hypothetical protein